MNDPVIDALKEMGKAVYCLHLELEPSIMNDVQQRFDDLHNAIYAERKQKAS